MSEASAWRHWERHVSDKLKAARRVSVLKPGSDLETLLKEEGVGVLENIKIVRAALLFRYDQAVQAGDASAMTALSAQLHRNFELQAKLTGELVNRSEVTTKALFIAPEWLTVRAVLLRALTPYPDALYAVAEALRQVETTTPTNPPKTIEGATVARG